VPSEFRRLAQWNPMTGLIEGYRSALLLGRPPSLDLLGPALIVSLGVFLLGLICFWRMEGSVSDFL